MSPAYYGLKSILAKEPVPTDEEMEYYDCEPEPIPVRCGGCNNQADPNSAISKYQRLQVIQNTVRVSSSMYSMNIAALTVFQKPDEGKRINWKQSSDRKEAHVQKSRTSMRSSVSVRPGNLSPGGIGVDIKHNSYARYLARLKGGRSLRKEPLPENFEHLSITFMRGNPIYGGKVIKTSIGTNKCELNA
jgi:hypothetical protein